jgi:signal peptidase I
MENENLNNTPEVENNTPEPKKKSFSILKEILQWIEVIVIAVVIALLVRGFLFEPVEVIGQSMQDTLFTNQRLITYKLGYNFAPPKRGDIIVLEFKEGVLNKLLPLPDPNEIDYIKRVIGLPGDELDLRDGAVYLNGVKLDEPYAKGITLKQSLDFPLKVPEKSVFVMGDNRQNSSDSRQIGFIAYSRIKGKAVFRIWPFKDFGNIYKQ